jgi:hypothetical protein
MQGNRDGSSSVLLPGPSTVASSISDPPPRTPYRDQTAADIRCIITKGIENWFLTGDTKDPESIEPIDQIGWFQALKGFTPKECTLKQEGFYRRRRQTTKYYTGEQWTKEF